MALRSSKQEAKATKKVGRPISEDLEKRLADLTQQAQSSYLDGDANKALEYATQAVRIHPSSLLFSIMASASELKGDYLKASDFRLLQALFGRDKVLWTELLAEFESQGQFFKATLCLQRIAAMTTNKEEKKQAHLRRADLYIGLGEVARANTIYLSLWKSSGGKDFEVLATMSSLFFQLGRLTTLDDLVSRSLDGLLIPSKGDDSEEEEVDEGEDDGDDSDAEGDKKKPKVGRPKKVVGVKVKKEKEDQGKSDEKEGTKNEQQGESEVKETTESSATAPVAVISQDAQKRAQKLQEKASRGDPSLLELSKKARRRLKRKILRPEWVKRFLTLVNIRAELLIEKGEYVKAIEQVYLAAKALEIKVEHLAPDILVRLGVANAYLGNIEIARSVFKELVNSCDPSEFGDALYDGAVALLKIGQTEMSRKILLFLQSSEEFKIAAVYFQLGQSFKKEGRFKEAKNHFAKVLEEDPLHPETRIALSEVYYDEGKDADAIGAVEPLPSSTTTFSSSTTAGGGVSVDPALRVFGSNGNLLNHETAGKTAEDPFNRVVLDSRLSKVLFQTEHYDRSVAVILPWLEKMLVADDQTESIATGTSKRKRVKNYIPKALGATSAIVPADSLSIGLAASGGPSGGSSIGGLGSIAPASLSVATSFRSSGNASSVRLQRTGAALSSVASSRGALTEGGGKDNQKLTDPSAIFRFKRNRKKGKPSASGNKKNDSAAVDEQNQREAAAEKRRSQLVQNLKEGGDGHHQEKGDDQLMERGSVGNIDDLEEMEKLQALEEAENFFQEEEQKREEDGERKTKRVRFEDPKSEASGEVENPTPAFVFRSQGEDTTGTAMPSLEDLARSFDDPQLAALFVQANSNLPSSAAEGSADDGSGDQLLHGEGQQPPLKGDAKPEATTLRNQLEVDAQRQAEKEHGERQQQDDFAVMIAKAQQASDEKRQPNQDDIWQLLGPEGTFDAIFRVIACYRKLDQVLDAKNFVEAMLQCGVIRVATRRKFTSFIKRMEMEALKLGLETGVQHGAVARAVRIMSFLDSEEFSSIDDTRTSSTGSRGPGGIETTGISTSSQSRRDEAVKEIFSALNKSFFGTASLTEMTTGVGYKGSSSFNQNSLAILRRRNIREVPAFQLTGNRFFSHCSYQHALKFYILALVYDRKKKGLKSPLSHLQEEKLLNSKVQNRGFQQQQVPTNQAGGADGTVEEDYLEGGLQEDDVRLDDDEQAVLDSIMDPVAAAQEEGTSGEGEDGATTSTTTTTIKVLPQDDPLLHFQIGLCYLFLMGRSDRYGRHGRQTSKHILAAHALGYLKQYFDLSYSAQVQVTSDQNLEGAPPSASGEAAPPQLQHHHRYFVSHSPEFEAEALFNMGRAHQYIRLNYLAVDWYESTIKLCKFQLQSLPTTSSLPAGVQQQQGDDGDGTATNHPKVGVVDESSSSYRQRQVVGVRERLIALQQAAAINLSGLYKQSGNNALAMQTTWENCPMLGSK